MSNFDQNWLLFGSFVDTGQLYTLLCFISMQKYIIMFYSLAKIT